MEQIDYTNIGQLVRKLRKDKDWSQTELGEQAGCSFSAISRFEHGTLFPPTLKLARIVGAFEMSLSEFFKRYENYYLISLPPLKQDLFIAAHITDEIKPCPFCGEKTILTGGFQNSVSLIIGYRIFCTNSRCTAMITAQGETAEEARNHAIERWNKRTPNKSLNADQKSAEKIQW